MVEQTSTGFFSRLRAAFRAQPRALTPADTQVVSFETSIYGLASSLQRINPDDLTRKKGLKVFAQMRLDEQVKAVVTFKRDAVLSRGWTFEWDKESKLPETERAKRVRVFEQIVAKFPGTFIDALNKIAVGREYGFSLTEKVYELIDVDGEQWVGLRAMKARDPQYFQFYTDAYGELERVEQEVGGQRVVFEDLSKFVHYVHNPEFDEYFGRSDLREAYRSWLSKDVTIRFWNVYLEKLGGGMLIASIGENTTLTPNSPAYRQLQSALANAKATASMLLPPGVTANVVFPQNATAYEQAIKYHDLAIAKALLVPNLMGVSNTGDTGSYSQSQTQLESFAWTLKADSERLQSCIDEQLFRDLGARNWGDGEYPCFKFKPLSTEGLRYLITTWGQLIGQGAIIPTEDDERRLREILEMPPRDESSKTLQEVKQELMPAPLPANPDPGQERAVQDVVDAAKEEMRRISDAVRFGFNPDQPRDNEGQWTDGAGGGSINASSKKQFEKQVADLYSAQGVEDWQGDYFAELSLRKYFGNEQSFRVNNALRTNGKLDPRAAEAAKAVDEAFGKHAVSLSDDTVLHRAVSGEFSSQLLSMKEGDSFVDRGYVSTAGTIKATERFGKVRMEIVPKAGIKALLYKDETEVLLPKGTKFTVIGQKAGPKGVTIVRVRAA